MIGPLQEVDVVRLLAAIPTASLIVRPDGTIIAANPAYEQVSGRSHTDLVGRTVTEVFPDNPYEPRSAGSGNLADSFDRVLATGLTERMPVQRYDVADPITGGYSERYWSAVNAAVRDDRGRTTAILHQVEELAEPAELHRSRGPEDAPRRERSAARRRQAVREQILLRLVTASTAALGTEAKLIALAHAAVPALCDVCAVYLLDDPVPAGRPVDTIRTRRLTAPTSAGVVGPVAGQMSTWAGGDPVTRAVAAASTVFVDYTPDAPPDWAVAAGVDQAIRDGRVHSTALIPVIVDELVHGFIAFGAGPDRPAYDGRHRELFELVAVQTAVAMRQGDRYDHVRDISLILQRSMLSDPPDVSDLDVVVRYRPAGDGTEVGGDWHDVFHLGAAHAGPGLAVAVGDVAGHDMTAAAVMGQVRSMLRGFTVHNGGPPDRTLTALDDVIRQTRLTHLATCVLMHVTPAAGPSSGLELTWSNAGHPAPILIDPSGRTLALSEPRDPALGPMLLAQRTSAHRRLPPGSTLLLFSDGLFERRNLDYDECYDQLRRTASRLHHLSVSALCDALLTSAPHDDDVVLIALRQR